MIAANTTAVAVIDDYLMILQREDAPINPSVHLFIQFIYPSICTHTHTLLPPFHKT